ncbi:ATP-dependent DNA helicase RecG [Anaerocolumna sedimenticola]|uniref:ATP-dependent DNA helicase RecG n=1 Tax=Anaerocolumna sedimenticola TaxID=2696063 RepID=A0A6P1TRG7_9FIRM|nr:ATP-dependent DNA helicase RecG [Anaerocolumna sedimenticola]QHQ62511.1 ATP-dependent DNA helicase RecG [Anaerocolumna sedimenticola]
MRDSGLITLTGPLRAIKGIGEKTEKDFNKMGLYTIEDLLKHYPRAYDVFEAPIPIINITEGKIVSIEASVIQAVQAKQVRNLKIISCQVKDSSGKLHLSWFNMPFLRNKLHMGYHFIFRGKVVRKNGILVIEQPNIYTREEYRLKMNVLQPVYILTAGITNNAISKAVKTALEQLDLSKDYLPKRILKEYHLINYKNAIQEIHFPKCFDTMADARTRLVFDEFFQFTLALQALKEKKKVWNNDFRIIEQEGCDRFISELPYQLTKAQLKVWKEIKSDLTGNHTMNRLVQGDVGSGKTILAALALLLTTLNGYQGSLMVPTEVLAKQHYESMNRMFSDYGIKTILLVGSMTTSEKKKAYEKIKNHEVDVIIGTHALIQEKVEYDNLALAVTDEQHRFGVRQREALSGKGIHPHVLVMSATPIPRTLAIILYGDLDISIVDELPANRLPIKNCVVDTGYRPTAYRFIAKEVREGRQAYVICPMVDESEVIEAENVLEYTEKLKEAMPSDIIVEYLHGKMKPKEKNEIMERFSAGDIQVLVSTTVVEVGVNVPNATVMMIENAERFGLAQLHQLRGRVGRGQHQSYCILVSGSGGRETKERLEILNKSNDGFYIAGEDLKLRGPGDMFGIRQSGDMEFRIGDIYNDASVLMKANEAAKSLTKPEFDLFLEENPELADKINFFDMGTL